MTLSLFQQPMAFAHSYPFDPAYGYALDSLLMIAPPEEPADFVEFWTRRRQRMEGLPPRTRLRQSKIKHPDYEVFNLSFRSVDDTKIRGWLTVPKRSAVTRVLIMGHGYGGAIEPSFDSPLPDAACLFPCFRGLGRSKGPPYSDNPFFHVTHDIHQREHYVLGGCVDDLWMAVSAALSLYPAAEGRIGYCGISFSGGIGALALPWEPRVQLAHLNVPTFGHHPVRLPLPTVGSTRALARYVAAHPEVRDNLPYFDAAVAARHIRIPVHVAAALFDPSVAPPAQFAIYNALTAQRTLFVLEAGHFSHPNDTLTATRLREDLSAFFTPL